MNNIEWFEWDGQFLLFLQEHVRSAALDPFMKFVTRLGDHGMIWIALILIFLFISSTRRIGIAAIFSLAANYTICNLIIKNAVARMRPYDAIEGLTRIVGEQSDYSFPSGHASNSFAAAIMIFYMLPKGRKWIGVLLLILSAFISFSRLYVGVHYPTDVIAGVFIGILVGTIVYLILRGLKMVSPDEDGIT